MKLGSLSISGRLWLAPMVRVTDPAFRVLCREQGAALAFTEMISAEALARKISKIVEETKAHKSDRPLGVQIAANNPKTAALAVQNADPSADLFDLNLGCPVRKATSQGVGSALLSDPVKIGEIISAMRKATDKPITAKMRVPYKVETAVEIAKILEKNGCDAITIHARTPKQFHTGIINFDAVRLIRESIGIPVINNGGVRDKESLELIFEKTGCEAVMLARSAIGNPGIFAELSGKKGISKIDGLKRYLVLCQELGFTHSGRIKQQAIRFASANKSADLVKKLEKVRSIEDCTNSINTLFP
ncbi:MAG: tRNA-dihydrouridine synthase family protein [Candidatus Micrarchaeota archaeon]